MHKNYIAFKSLEWEKIKIPKIINISTLILISISLLIGQYIVSLKDLSDSIKQMPFLILLIPLLIIIYIIMHELLHGILMKFYSGISAEYGFSGPFIFAKSEAVFDKRAYILITLAPMLILGVIPIVLSFIGSRL